MCGLFWKVLRHRLVVGPEENRYFCLGWELMSGPYEYEAGMINAQQTCYVCIGSLYVLWIQYETVPR